MAQRATRSGNKRKRQETSDPAVKSPSVAKPKKTARTGSLSDKKDSRTKPTKSTKLGNDIHSEKIYKSNATKVLGRDDELIEDVVSALFSKRNTCALRGFNPVAPLSGNFLHYMHELQSGQRTTPKLRQSLSGTVVNRLSELHLYRTASPFERRCTAVEWHPTRPGVVAIGSKGGEILVWDINTVNKDILIPGTGPAGSIQALKFQPRDHSRVVTSSINGTVSVHNLKTSQKEVFMDTLNSHDDWYCSLDFHHPTNVATVGDNHGNVTLKSLDGKTVFAGRLHRQKVTHVEYSQREEWLLATASVDQTVQLWDIRMLEGRNSALAVLKHDKPVNSVYFSPSTGGRLLTTDQHSELRVYNSLTFDLSQIIAHPHRHFRHITPHKACWHPLWDVVVVGRYPDEKFPGYTAGELRTIDMFDAETGRLVHQLHDPQAKGIVSLNKFSHNGEYLASTMGMNVLLWSPRYDIEEKHRGLMTSLTENGLVTGKTTGRRAAPRPRQTKAKKEEEKTSQVKLKVKVTKTKTKR